jgi:phosphomannomutase
MKDFTPALRETLDYEPVPLKFGTSGRRGLVCDLTQLEIYINAYAELAYLKTLPPGAGGIEAGQEFFFGCDLRPSSTRFDAAAGGRGEIAQAIHQAILDAGLRPVFLGALPTPALAFYALRRHRGSMMITGSHIPFDRNGYKTNTAGGELLKKDEAPINALVEQTRQEIYASPAAGSPFNPHGMFRSGVRALPEPEPGALTEYLDRYVGFFGSRALAGSRLLVYQHSAVGRDLLPELLRRLGAEVFTAGRSEVFVPIDTENIDDAQLRAIQRLADEAWRQHGPFDAVVSTDGDSDRPLILGVDAAPDGCRVRFFGGDLVGMIVAGFLQADAAVVPISCNDAIDRIPLARALERKTRIGSPFVIAGMEAARARGRRAVCGWEANGGFLTGSNIERHGRVLASLPTRDAMLPILGVLAAAGERGVRVSELFDALPPRYSKAALLRNFPRPVSERMIRSFTPAITGLVEFTTAPWQIVRGDGATASATSQEESTLQALVRRLNAVFDAPHGFSSIAKVNYTDGVRIYFANGDVAHVRPSGNADELRIYAVADIRERAEEIAAAGVSEPNGLLRRLAAAS